MSGFKIACLILHPLLVLALAIHSSASAQPIPTLSNKAFSFKSPSITKSPSIKTFFIVAPSPLPIIPQQAAAGGADKQAPLSSATLTQWGIDTLQQIRTEFYLPKKHLYADEIKPGEPAPDKPAVMWGCGVQLAALAAAARVDAAWKPRLLDFAAAMDRYWTDQNLTIVGGYDVLPVPKPLDRYYDDNEWIVIAMAEGYDVTADAALKARAEKAMIFVMSGEDKKLGGGIYWHEQEKQSKNTCSNAPAIVAAMRLFQLTRRQEYLITARRLTLWTNAHLQDTDGLYWDNIKLNGVIDKTKWSYNTALMLRANCLLYQETHENAYLEEARRLAHAAEAQWVKPETGAMADDGKFAHLLCEAFLFLSDLESDAPAITHWRTIVRKALVFVHDQVRDMNGHYGNRWEMPATEAHMKATLLDQASVARAFLVDARY